MPNDQRTPSAVSSPTCNRTECALSSQRMLHLLAGARQISRPRHFASLIQQSLKCETRSMTQRPPQKTAQHRATTRDLAVTCDPRSQRARQMSRRQLCDCPRHSTPRVKFLGRARRPRIPRSNQRRLFHHRHATDQPALRALLRARPLNLERCRERMYRDDPRTKPADGPGAQNSIDVYLAFLAASKFSR